MAKICEKHIKGLVCIKRTGWLAIIILVFLNWARDAVNLGSAEKICQDTHDAIDLHCRNMVQIKVFLTAGMIFRAY